VASRYLDSIYNTVINNDILERNVTEEKTKIADPFLLRKLVLFLADNTGKEFSYNKVTAAMNENQRLSDDENVGNHKVMSYMKGLLNAFVFYEAGRCDLRGKKLLKTNGKYYIVDLGLRNYLLGYKPYDRGFTLENLVYFELLRRGYTVNVGKVDTLEIDFRAVKGSNVQYFQITESLKDEATRNREIRPFDMIDDHYERVILTMDKGAYNINGIRVLNIVDWLLEE
jgi:predicted AAA+ superfamily ATPase